MTPAHKARAIYHEALEHVLDSVLGGGQPIVPRDALAFEGFEKEMPDGSVRRGYRVRIQMEVEIGSHDASMNPKWRGRW